MKARAARTRAPGYGLGQRQHGMTLVELMVALVLGLLIALAAAASLLLARQGFAAVDAASQLRDNGRFLQSLIQRLGVQTGYKDPRFATNTTQRPDAAQGGAPNVFGLNNNARVLTLPWGDGSARSPGTLAYGSDILVLRFQTSSANIEAASSDKTMIDCAGIAPAAVPRDADDKLVSILHVAQGDDGEPALMCSRSDNGKPPYTDFPLVSGVENFQLLYGVDNPGNADNVPDRYLRADELTDANNNRAATYANWRRVRSIRVGVVLRGPPGSAMDRSSQTFYPLGISKGSAAGGDGSAFSSSSDPGSEYTPAVDGRLRQTLTFTVHLRNFQGVN